MEKGLRSRPFFTLPCPPVQPACVLYNVSIICLFSLHYGHLQRFAVLVYLSFSPTVYCDTCRGYLCVRTLPLIPDTSAAIPGWLSCGFFCSSLIFVFLYYRFPQIFRTFSRISLSRTIPPVHKKKACPELAERPDTSLQ